LETIVRERRLDRETMPMILTTFHPELHGFLFKNDDMSWSVGPFSGHVLCGGMAYSALDYFYSRLEIPQVEKAPAEGSRLQSYIFNRQVTAHANTVPRFVGSWLPVIRALIADIATMTSGEFTKLTKYLRSGTPIPMCLVGSFHGHHVVAIGCAADRPPVIQVYDPNYPGKLVTIKLLAGKGFHHSIEGSLWDGFFVDDAYSTKIPPVLAGQDNWRWCRKCQGLFFYGNPTNGVCPAGGEHDSTSSSNYMLMINKGNGQPDWRWCWKCEGLYYAGRPDSAGLCPAGGIHNGIRSGNYFLALGSGTGQSNWRWCQMCEGLFSYANRSLGCCPGNSNGHDGSASGNFVLTPI